LAGLNQYDNLQNNATEQQVLNGFFTVIPGNLSGIFIG